MGVKRNDEQSVQSMEFITSSQLELHPTIADWLTKHMTGNPFNKYCIDCKKRQTSHFLLWYGTFVCEECANLHQRLNDFQHSRVYVKHVLHEQWDDYQLRAVALGGNKKLYEIFKEYDIGNLPTEEKYRHKCTKWYSKTFVANLDNKGY